MNKGPGGGAAIMKDTIHDGKHQSMQFQEGDVVMMDFNLKGKTKPRESKLKTK